MRVSSMTSMLRSARGKRRLEESFSMLMRPRKANSRTMQPRRAYEMLSFQKERYPCDRTVLDMPAYPSSQAHCVLAIVKTGVAYLLVLETK